MDRFVSLTSLLLAACGQPADLGMGVNDVAPVSTTSPAMTPRVVKSEPEQKTGTAGRPSVDASNAGVHDVLADVLVPVGQIDGERITSMTQRSRCVTAFSTTGGNAVVEWTKIGDFQARLGKGRVEIPIEVDGRARIFSTPEAKQPEPVGNAGDRMEMAFGSMVDACGAR